jgi:glucose/arabinose dehydrogenase
MKYWIALATCGSLAVAGGGLRAQTTNADHPGDQHLIRVQDLPRPHATPSVDNPPTVVPRRKNALPEVPPGFSVNLFATGLNGTNCPRLMTVAPNGDLFVAESGTSRILVLRDRHGKGKADLVKVFASRGQGLYLPFGMAFSGNWLYVADTDRIIRYAYQPGQLTAKSAPELIVDGLPGGGYHQHWTRDILVDPVRNKLYLTVGSQTNDSEEAPIRAAIDEYNLDGTGYRRYAYGLRNPVGLAVNPVTGSLWCTCNERDEFGDDLMPDYFTAVQDGGFYGWPYYYIGPNRDPNHAGQHPELQNLSIVPDVLFQAHSASLGCAFYNGTQFPEEYRGDAFVAFHGSWNRSVRTGYKVVRVRFANGQPVGGYEDFMTGFMTDPTSQKVWGRPVGVTVAADGSLLVSDDGGHCIWRVSYTQAQAGARAQPRQRLSGVGPAPRTPLP